MLMGLKDPKHYSIKFSGGWKALKYHNRLIMNPRPPFCRQPGVLFV